MGTGNINFSGLSSINYGPNDYADENWVERVVINGNTEWEELNPVTRKENIIYWNTFDVKHSETNGLSNTETNIGSLKGLWKDIKRGHYWLSNLTGGCLKNSVFNDVPSFSGYPATNYGWGVDADGHDLDCYGGWSSSGQSWAQYNTYGIIDLSQIPSDKTTPTIPSNYSYSIWLKFTKENPSFRFYHNGGTSGNPDDTTNETNFFRVEKWSGKVYVWVGNGNPSTGLVENDLQLSSFGTIADNEWTNIVVSVSNKVATVYRDGSAWTTSAGYSFDLTHTSQTNISDNDRWFKMLLNGGIRIDDFRIYNIALSEREAGHIYSRRNKVGDYNGGGSFLKFDDSNTDTEIKNDNSGISYSDQIKAYKEIESGLEFDKRFSEYRESIDLSKLETIVKINKSSVVLDGISKEFELSEKNEQKENNRT